MNVLLLWTLFPALAMAEPQVAQVDIVDGKTDSELAVVLPQSGAPAELSVSGPITTKLSLRKAGLGLEFDVEQVAADHTSFRARGEVITPPAGKRVILARIPRPSGGSAEVHLILR